MYSCDLLRRRLPFWCLTRAALRLCQSFTAASQSSGLRVEDPATFRAIHSLLSEVDLRRSATGFSRLDHIDGLRDPARYTKRLSHMVRKLQREAELPTAFYVIVEKILADGVDEHMRKHV